MLPSYHNGFAHFAGESEYPGLWSRLTGWWAPLLGPTGLILRDGSKHQNHGALGNMDVGDWVIAPPYGYALDFDNANDEVVIPKPGVVFEDGFSVMVWAKVNDLTEDQRAFNQWDAGDVPSMVFTLWMDTGGTDGWAFGLADGAATYLLVGTGNADAVTTRYQCVLGTYSAKRATIYVDGQQTDTDTWAVSVNDIADNIRLGTFKNDTAVGERFNGRILAAGFWGRALVAREAQILARCPGGPLTLKRRTIVRVPAVGFARSKVGASLAHGRGRLVA